MFIVVVTASLAVLLLVAGTAVLNNWVVRSDAAEVPPLPASVPRCAAAVLDVTSLRTSATAACDLTGVELLFPGGFEAIVPGVGDVDGTEDDQHSKCAAAYSILNDGADGVAAYRVSGDGKTVTWWGNPKAVEKWRLSLGQLDASACGG